MLLIVDLGHFEIPDVLEFAEVLWRVGRFGIQTFRNSDVSILETFGSFWCVG